MLELLADIDDSVDPGPRVWLPPIPSAQDYLSRMIRVDGVLVTMIAGGASIKREPVPSDDPAGDRQVGLVRGVLAEKVIISTTLDPYLDLRALIGYSGFGRSTLLGYMADKDNPLPHYRVALTGKIVCRVSEFDAWLRQFRRTESAIDHLVQQRRVARAAGRARRQEG